MPLLSSCKYPIRQVLPPDQTVCEGELVELNIPIQWPEPCIQWQVLKTNTWTNIRRATKPILSFIAQSSEDGNKYRALVEGKCERWVTNVFELTVNYIEITLNPLSTQGIVGDTVIFTASAVGKPPITGIQWQVSTNNGQSWTNLTGETTTTLTLTNLTISQCCYLYRAVFTNSTCFLSNCITCNQPTQPARLIVEEYYAYVTNLTDSLSVIRSSNTSSINISQAEGDFNQPVAIAITPDKQFVYVVNTGNNSVSVIQTSDNTLITNITSPDFDNSLAIVISPNGQYAYVVNNSISSVSVIQTSNNTVFTTITSGVGLFNTPVTIAIHPNGQYIYVVNIGDNSLSIIRTSDNTLVTNITSAEGQFNLALDVAVTEQYFYVTNSNSNTVSVFNTSDNTYITSISPFDRPTLIEITPDEQYAYVFNEGNDSISIIQVSTNTIVSTISEADGHFNFVARFAFTPDGKYLYATNGGDDTISIIDVSTNMWVQTITSAEGQLSGAFAIAITTLPSC